MFRQHWQTMLNKCCLNGPVPTGLLDKDSQGALEPLLLKQIPAFSNKGKILILLLNISRSSLPIWLYRSIDIQQL